MRGCGHGAGRRESCDGLLGKLTSCVLAFAVVALTALLVTACGSSSTSGSASSNTVEASAAYCAQARAVAGEALALIKDPGRVKADFSSFYKLQDLAPDQIRPDVVVVSDYYKKVASLLPDDPSKAQLDKALQTAAQSTAYAGVPDAASKVTTFTSQACGVTLNPSSSS